MEMIFREILNLENRHYCVFSVSQNLLKIWNIPVWLKKFCLAKFQVHLQGESSQNLQH